MVINRKAKIHTLAAMGGMASHARDIWVEHPYVREITELAYLRFGYLSIDEGKSVLLAQAICRATRAYTAAKRKEGDFQPPVCYFKAFFESLSVVLDYEVLIGGERWQPLKSSFTDMVGDIKIRKSTDRWPSKKIPPLSAMILSFLEDDACQVITKCKLPQELADAS